MSDQDSQDLPESLASSHLRDASSISTRTSESMIEVIPQGIDIEEEARLYEELCDVRSCFSHLRSAQALTIP